MLSLACFFFQSPRTLTRRLKQNKNERAFCSYFYFKLSMMRYISKKPGREVVIASKKVKARQLQHIKKHWITEEKDVADFLRCCRPAAQLALYVVLEDRRVSSGGHDSRVAPRIWEWIGPNASLQELPLPTCFFLPSFIFCTDNAEKSGERSSCKLFFSSVPTYLSHLGSRTDKANAGHWVIFLPLWYDLWANKACSPRVSLSETNTILFRHIVGSSSPFFM